MKIPAWILVGMLPFASAVCCAHESGGAAPASRATWSPLSQSLAISSDPRDWILAAILSSTPRSAEIAAVFAKAAAAAPDDVLVQWLAAVRDDETAITTLTRLEPDNGASWLPALDSAIRHKDAAGIDAALAGFSASTRFDDHFGQLLHAWQAALQRQPDTGVCEAGKACDRAERDFTLAMAMTSASAFPALQSILSFCKATSTHSLRHQQCETGARRMLEGGNTLVSSSIGFALLRNLDALTPADEELRGQRDWLQEVTLPLHRDFVSGAPGFAEFVADWSTLDSELEVMRRLAQRAGQPLTPPDGWVSPRQRARDAEKARGEP